MAENVGTVVVTVSPILGTCKDCKHWGQERVEVKPLRLCKAPTPTREQWCSPVTTGPDFGCIFYEAKNGTER